MGMTLLNAKILALFGQVAVLTTCVLAPIWVESYVMKKGVAGQIFLSCCRCFGGGALLGSYMLHMTPEINHLLGTSLMEPNDITYPIPEIIAGAGFFFFLYVEWFILWRDKKYQKKVAKKNERSGGETNAAFTVETEFKRYDSMEGSFTNLNQENTVYGAQDSNGTVPGSTESVPATVTTQDSKVDLVDEKKEEAENTEGVVDGPSDPESGARSMILLVALCADGLFQGLAIGLKWTNVEMWNLFIAVVGHEFVVAFCLGLELVRSQTRKRVIIFGIFYGMTPAVGTAIGIAIFEVSGNNSDPMKTDLINGILQAIATGVFLYVAFIGILGEEMTNHPRFISLTSVLIGFLLMAGLALLIPAPTAHGVDPTADPHYWFDF